METCYFDFDGGRIAYDEMGRGPLIICIPSMGDVRAEYRFLAPQLASAYYHVISIDVRGHGESSTNWSDYSVTAIGRDLIALIRTIDAGPAVLIGTSMGAGAAVYAAGEAPELVAGVLLIDPFVRGRPSLWSGLLYSALLTQPWGPSAWIRYYSTLYPTHKPQDFAQYTAALKRNLEEPGRMNALKQMALASKAESEKQLPCVTAPAVVIMGSKDPDFKEPEAEAQWLANKLNTRHKMIKDAGHYPHVEMPELTGQFILGFIKQLKRTEKEFSEHG